MKKQPVENTEIHSTDKFEVVECANHRELPTDVEMMMYEPPYYGDPMEEIAKQFVDRFGYQAKRFYKVLNQIYIVLEDK